LLHQSACSENRRGRGATGGGPAGVGMRMVWWTPLVAEQHRRSCERVKRSSTITPARSTVPPADILLFQKVECPLFRSGLRRDRTGAAGRGGAAQESFGAEVFVDIRPMDAVPTAARSPVRPLLGRGVQQSGIPCQRNRDRAPVDEIDAQRILVATHVFDALARANLRRIHGPPFPLTIIPLGDGSCQLRPPARRSCRENHANYPACPCTTSIIASMFSSGTSPSTSWAGAKM